MNSKVSKISNTVFIVIIIGIFGILCIINLEEFIDIFQEKTNSIESQAVQDVFSNIESTFRENLENKNELTDLYGVYQKMMGHTMVGNFEYVSDENGILHMINDMGQYSLDNFVAEVVELNDYLDSQGIPFLYVQTPNREIVNKGTAIDDFNIDDEAMDVTVTNLQNQGVPVLDIRELLENKDLPFDLTDLYFHTDLHMQTDAEIWMASQVAKCLVEDFQLDLKNIDYLSDLSYYDKKSYEFIGNYARTNGKYFVGVDYFDIYHPRFNTLYEYLVPGDENSHVEGCFDDVVLNGYEKIQDYNEYTYWVTDFMHFTLPYYKYINKEQSDYKILIINDSVSYRAVSYLTLLVNEITILDPRFFGDTDYLRIALEDDYDMVILWNAFLSNEPFLLK